jgi:hypothetical protein
MGNGNSTIKHVTRKNMQHHCRQLHCRDDSLVLSNQSTSRSEIITILISTINDMTLPRINNTLSAEHETELINHAIDAGDMNIQIVIYGKNGNDPSIVVKYNQLIGLGFPNVKLYLGGITEWLLLQEIFGTEMYPMCDGMKEHDRMNLIIQLLAC